ncbi:hypothetical protein MKZ38_007423 [Zalerion maritima]|uniref:ESCRT-II complex subunit VPS25 n=1 Tax=Zalerion maritima TaxID=339359 RepID=A0AAD5RWI8_9PEZI|nr:hypothetical protein MKZ38_007423 [Zalerion maritima]
MASPPDDPSSTSAAPPYPFPKEHSFPPFFTIQPNESTRYAQLAKWNAIVLSYFAHHRLWKLSLSEAVVERPAGAAAAPGPSPPFGIPPPRDGDDGAAAAAAAAGGGGGGGGGAQRPRAPRDLFYNWRLDKRLNMEGARQVLAYMAKEGTAEEINDRESRSTLQSLGLAAPATAQGQKPQQPQQDTWWIWWRPVQEWANLLEKWIEDTGQRGSVLTVWEINHGEGARGTEFYGMDGEVLRRVLATLVKRGKAQVFGEGEDVGVKFF